MPTTKLASSPAARSLKAFAAGKTEATNPPSSDWTISAAWAYSTFHFFKQSIVEVQRAGGFELRGRYAGETKYTDPRRGLH